MSEGDVRRDHTGAASFDAGRTDAGALVEIPSVDVDDAEVAVKGHHLDDEPGTVECHVRGGERAHVSLSFDPVDADDLARRLAEAATFAAEGEDV